jgi:hypothetical protein
MAVIYVGDGLRFRLSRLRDLFHAMESESNFGNGSQALICWKFLPLPLLLFLHLVEALVDG